LVSLLVFVQQIYFTIFIPAGVLYTVLMFSNKSPHNMQRSTHAAVYD